MFSSWMVRATWEQRACETWAMGSSTKESTFLRTKFFGLLPLTPQTKVVQESVSGFLGHKAKGPYSPTGRSKHHLEPPFQEPLPRTLFPLRAHQKTPCKNPWEPSAKPFSDFENHLLIALLRRVRCRTLPFELNLENHLIPVECVFELREITRLESLSLSHSFQSPLPDTNVSELSG